MGERDVYFRLLIALLLSVALHASFIYGVAPRPGALARPVAPLAARLIPDVTHAVPARSKRISPAPPEAAAPSPKSLSVPKAQPEVPLVAAPAAIGAEAEQRREDSALPKADLPFPVDLQWYEARDLDSYPRAMTSLDPPYPAGADTLRGEVTLLVSIDETGAVRDASIIDAEPAGHFETAALASIRQARFTAGERDGHAVRSRIVVKLRFEPREQALR